MPKPIRSTAAILALMLASCVPPPPVPPPRFRPNPPYPPQPVDPSGQSADPYYQTGEEEPLEPPTLPAPPAKPSRNPADYPAAKRTDDPDLVISPFEPYHTIIVEGLHSGDLARDPSNYKIFRVP